MIIDGIPFKEGTSAQSSPKSRAVEAFITFIERKTGARVLYDRRRFPHGRMDLSEAFAVATRLRERNIVDAINPIPSLPDEPAFKSWTCRLVNEQISEDKYTGGSSVESDRDALHAALAEALERYLWRTQTDYFVRPIRATTAEISQRGHFVAPEKFMGFSPEQRARNQKWALSPDASYLWIQGTSLITGKKAYIPAQIVSPAHVRKENYREPLIRTLTTIGLATWPTKNEARLRGALECIERDAYMIWWLNQLTLPHIALPPMRQKSAALDLLLERCERYRLKVYAIQMLTDAPTHAILSVIEDLSGQAPRFAFGLKAHRSLPHAIEKATLEALRARRNYRARMADGKKWDAATPVDKIRHVDRTFYWAEKKNSEKLTWITEGGEIDVPEASWEKDSSEQHMEKILAWCRSQMYECIAVSLGTSKANPTNWSVEMVVMPNLQPAYLNESMRHISGDRLTKIPSLFGYTPRPAPYVEGPHPAA